ncbi:MAG: putative metal-binding motif-containing protein [Deltaproteobacteria bacterium]|nr:putative metal-binding motif-containing protein [Deltaproteobacteria bacterium]
MLTMHKFLIFMALVLVMSLSVACGCGDDDDDDDSSSPDDDDDDDDNDTDDDDDTGSTECVDEDGDGFGENCEAGADCNDYDAAAYQVLTGYLDVDSDGYPGTEVSICGGEALPAGYFSYSDDCNDASAMSYPGAAEIPDDGEDQDCQGGDLTASNDNGIFVDGDSGSNANPGTMEEPVKTVQKGIDLAEGDTERVYIAAEEYDEDVQVAGVALYGGYDAADWSRDIEANETELTATVAYPIEVASDGWVRADGLTINGIDTGASFGVFGNPGAEITFSRLRINTFADGTGGFGVYNGSGGLTYLEDVVIDMTDNSSSLYGVQQVGGLFTADNLRILATGTTGTFYGVLLAGSAYGMVTNSSVVVDGPSANYGILASGASIEMRGTTLDMGDSPGVTYGVLVAGGAASFIDNDVTIGETASAFGMMLAPAYGGQLINNRIQIGEGLGSLYGIYSSGVPFATLTAMNNRVFVGNGPGETIAFYSTSSPLFSANNTLIAGEGSISIGAYVGLTTTEISSSYLVNNVIQSDEGSTSEWTVYMTTGAALPVLNLLNNDLAGESPDCLVKVNAGCVTDIGDVNECAWVGCREASGNLDDEPDLVDPAMGNFALVDTSPLIDAGVNPAPWAPDAAGDAIWYDYEMDVRPAGDGFDIGADEFLP